MKGSFMLHLLLLPLFILGTSVSLSIPVGFYLGWNAPTGIGWDRFILVLLAALTTLLVSGYLLTALLYFERL